MATQWFVEPRDEYTNIAIVGLLNNLLEPIDIVPDLKVGKENPHLTYRVSFKAINYLRASRRTDKDLRFNDFSREGERGKSKRNNFLDKRDREKERIRKALGK